MNKNLLKYIPKEYKNLVTYIGEANEKEYNEITKKWDVNIIVEWENGETSYFQNKSFMKNVLNEFHSPDEYRA